MPKWSKAIIAAATGRMFSSARRSIFSGLKSARLSSTRLFWLYRHLACLRCSIGFCENNWKCEGADVLSLLSFRAKSRNLSLKRKHTLRIDEGPYREDVRGNVRPLAPLGMTALGKKEFGYEQNEK